MGISLCYDFNHFLVASMKEIPYLSILGRLLALNQVMATSSQDITSSIGVLNILVIRNILLKVLIHAAMVILSSHVKWLLYS